jgi:hypothetical protein
MTRIFLNTWRLAKYVRVTCSQGWARDLKSRDRDDTETFESETETRLRPLPSSPRRDAIVFETSARPSIHFV